LIAADKIDTSACLKYDRYVCSLWDVCLNDAGTRKFQKVNHCKRNNPFSNNNSASRRRHQVVAGGAQRRLICLAGVGKEMDWSRKWGKKGGVINSLETYGPL
jgi:hypothetical protein